MSVEETLARLKALYFGATPATIADAFDEAIDALKTLPTEADRERAAVYMEGLAEMKREFAGRGGPKRSGNASRRTAEAAPKRRQR